jgi:hypothetical protein
MRRVLCLLLLTTQIGFIGLGQVKTAFDSAQDILENDFVHIIDLPRLPKRPYQLPIASQREAVCIQLFEQDRVSVVPQPLHFRVKYLQWGNRDSNLCPLNDGRMRSVLIELKSTPPMTPFVDDAVKLDRKHNQVLLENERVRIVRIHFRPGESGPMVDKRPRVIVLLISSHAQVKLPDGHIETRDGKVEDVQWSRGGRQATINGNVGPLENIVVELKGAEPKGK